MKTKRIMIMAAIVALLYPAWGCEHKRPKGDLICCCPAKICIWLPSWFVNSMAPMSEVDNIGNSVQSEGEFSFNLADHCQGPVGVEDPPLLKCCLSVISDSPGMTDMVEGASGSGIGLCYYEMPEYDLEVSQAGDGDGDQMFVPVDSDGDLICDQCDNCATVANAELTPLFNEDMQWAMSYSGDGDGDGDGPQITLVDSPDTDDDMVGDACDNCVLTHNPDQEDSDNNGIGNACEETVCPTIPETPPTDNTGGGSTGEGPGSPTVGLVNNSGSGCLSSLGDVAANGYHLSSLVWVISLLGFGLIRHRIRK